MFGRFYIGKGQYNMSLQSRYHDLSDQTSKEPMIEPGTEKHGTYGALLFDKRWVGKRAEIILRDKCRCVICSSNEKLQVHHRQYHFIKALKQFKAPWDYEHHLMITLCEKCHSRGHSKFRVPNHYV